MFIQRSRTPRDSALAAHAFLAQHSGTKDLRIVERFVSVQGEGSLVGVTSTFLRVSGCNLRCAWCDTPESSWDPEGERLSLSALLTSCTEGPKHVVLTGGEPLLFPAIVPLAKAIRMAGHHLTIESAGSLAIENLECDLFSISPKLKNSTPWDTASPALAKRHEEHRLNLDFLTIWLKKPSWQLKFVVRTASEQELALDLEEIEALLTALKISDHERERVFLMPEATSESALKRGYQALLDPCRHRGFRLGQRLHIILFGNTRGT